MKPFSEKELEEVLNSLLQKGALTQAKDDDGELWLQMTRTGERLLKEYKDLHDE